MAREFEGRVHRLDDLFGDEQRRIIGIVLQDRIEDYQRTFERLADQDEDVLNRLGQLQLPDPQAAPGRRLVVPRPPPPRRSSRGSRTTASLDAIRTLCERGRTWGYQPERDAAGEVALRGARSGPSAASTPTPTSPALAAQAGQLLDAAALLGISPRPLAGAEPVARRLRPARRLGRHEPAAPRRLRRPRRKLNISQDLLGWRP